MSTTYKAQSGDFWRDADGYAVKKNYISPRQMKSERELTKLINRAIKLEQELNLLFQDAENFMQKDFVEILCETGSDPLSKAIKSFTNKNFDGNLQIIREYQESVEYDFQSMQVAKAAFDEWISKVVTSEMVKKIINDVFSISGGRFDSRKINVMLALKNDPALIEDQQFQNALTLIQKARKKGSPRIYLKFLHRADKNKSLEPVNLNFSTLYNRETTDESDLK